MPKLGMSILACALLSLSFGRSNRSLSAAGMVNAIPQERSYKESHFYYDGQTWMQSWFQCDGTYDVTVFSQPSEGPSQSLLKFSKSSPRRKQVVNLARQDEPDCGMMKCWWMFKAIDQDR